MKLELKAKNTNYCAQIIKIGKPYKHPNADKLQIVSHQGNTVITGLQAQEGMIYVYFPLECKINIEYLSKTQSFSDPLLNTDRKTKGFFHSSGRVRAVRLRGQPSMGYIVPARQFFNDFINKDLDDKILDSLVGEYFDSIDGTIVCEKYIPASIKSSGGKNNTPNKKQAFSRLIEGQFRFHVDTESLKKNIHLIDPNDIITISYKLHGVSAVFSKVLCKRKLTIRDRIAKLFGAKVQETEYAHVCSSRSLIRTTDNHKEKCDDIWNDANKIIAPTLLEGITIYAEIVGFDKNNNYLQKGYDYGCDERQFKVYVYRITHTNIAGHVIEFTTPQIERYCKTFGLNMVPIIYHGRASSYLPFDGNKLDIIAISSWQKNLQEKISSSYLEKVCFMCKRDVPAEGIVLNIEAEKFIAFKMKSFAFLERETMQLDSGQVDLETEQSVPQN